MGRIRIAVLLAVALSPLLAGSRARAQGETNAQCSIMTRVQFETGVP